MTYYLWLYQQRWINMKDRCWASSYACDFYDQVIMQLTFKQVNYLLGLVYDGEYTDFWPV